jgi:hypothetical protein
MYQFLPWVSFMLKDQILLSKTNNTFLAQLLGFSGLSQVYALGRRESALSGLTSTHEPCAGAIVISYGFFLFCIFSGEIHVLPERMYEQVDSIMIYK